MKIKEVVTEMTSAGGVASVAMPIGTVQKRNPDAPKKKKKKTNNKK